MQNNFTLHRLKIKQKQIFIFIISDAAAAVVHFCSRTLISTIGGEFSVLGALAGVLVGLLESEVFCKDKETVQYIASSRNVKKLSCNH